MVCPGFLDGDSRWIIAVMTSGQFVVAELGRGEEVDD